MLMPPERSLAVRYAADQPLDECAHSFVSKRKAPHRPDCEIAERFAGLSGFNPIYIRPADLTPRYYASVAAASI